jgi:hypothetical protein
VRSDTSFALSRNNAPRSQRFVVEVAGFSSRSDRVLHSVFFVQRKRGASDSSDTSLALSRNNATRSQRFVVEVGGSSSRSGRVLHSVFEAQRKNPSTSHATDRSDSSSRSERGELGSKPPRARRSVFFARAVFPPGRHALLSHGTTRRDRSDLSSKPAIFPHATDLGAWHTSRAGPGRAIKSA